MTERKVALVHDWLVSQRGGENVLVQLADMFPDAPIYTLVHRRGCVDPILERRTIVTSFIQRLPGAPEQFRRYLPLFPRAVESWDLSKYNLVVSTSHCVAKGVRVSRRQTHVAYIHTPMRYLYDQLPHYLPPYAPRAAAPLARLVTWPLRRWDIRSARRPGQLIANSAFVAARIQRVWKRTARVVYPPVDVDFFRGTRAVAADAKIRFLVVSALVPYKRVDLAVLACRRLGQPLDVIGDGPERGRLEALAGPDTRFWGSLNRDALREKYAHARALLFCGEEDFGIVPVEAQAAGCPVIALGRGGARETVVDGHTGLWFHVPTAAALTQALQDFEHLGGPKAFATEALVRHAERFCSARFQASIANAIASACR